MTHNKIRSLLAAGIVKTLAAGQLPITLHSYQRETLEAVVRWLRKKKAPRRGYISQATGLGKTVEYSTIVKAAEGLRVLVIVPSKILVEQSIRDLSGFTEGAMAHASSLKDVVGDDGEVLAAHWRGEQHDIIVTTDETFKAQFASLKEELNPHVIIWDECHWAYTEKAQIALDAFSDVVVIGFSATPDYLTTSARNAYVPVTLDNGQTLYCAPDRLAKNYFPELLDERTVRWGIQNTFLAPLAWGQLDFTLKLEEVTVVDGPGGMDFDQAELQRVMNANWDFVVKTITKLYQSGQYDLASRFSAASCPGILHAESLAEALRGIGLKAEVITQKTKDADRNSILKRGRNGDLQFLSSVFALREGWNSPNAEVAMMLRPTKSRVFYMQFMGRVLRQLEGKVALVLDPHYQHDKFAPLSAPVLFGTPGQAVYNGGFLIGPSSGKGRKTAISPYMIERLEPILTIQPIEIEYWAGEDGTFVADGVLWATRNALTTFLGLSWAAIDFRIRRGSIIISRRVSRRKDKCRFRIGKTVNGQASIFYAFEDVKKVCSDLLQGIPVAIEDGTFEANDEVWATTVALSRLLGISIKAIRARLDQCRSRLAKTSGSVCNFYAVTDVRAACSDLLAITLVADYSGTFVADGEIWGTELVLARILSVSAKVVRGRVGMCRSREGKNVRGRLALFYSLSDMKEACRSVVRRLKKRKK